MPRRFLYSYLAPGTYTADVTITADGATNSPRILPVTLIIEAVQPLLEVTTEPLSFEAEQGGSPPAARVLTIANADAIHAFDQDRIGIGARGVSADQREGGRRQALDLLKRDPKTGVIVLVSKPPSQKVADELVNAARLVGKPVVVDFIGYATSTRQVDDVYFATTFDETAQLAVNLAGLAAESDPVRDTDPKEFAPGQRYLRGLFSGGTLAYEAMLILQRYLPAVYSNAPLDKKYRLEDSLVSQDHTVIDLGEDEFTVGRLLFLNLFHRTGREQTPLFDDAD